MSNKNILHSFDKLISPNIEYELHIGRYDPNTYRYSSLISKESFDKILSLTSLFDPKKTEYSISKVENCFDRDIRAVTTYYEGNKVTEFNKSVFANKEPIFEKKKTIHSFFWAYPWQFKGAIARSSTSNGKCGFSWQQYRLLG